MLRQSTQSTTLKVCRLCLLVVVLAAVLYAGCGGGTTSNGGTVITSSAPPPPSPAVHHIVQLTWIPSSTPDIGSYGVYRGSLTGGPYVLVGSTSGDQRVFTDTTVQAGRSYFYVVTAISRDLLESANSNEVRADVPSN